MSSRNESGKARVPSSSSRTNKTNQNFAIGQVIDNNDPKSAGRIRVKVKGIDDKIDSVTRAGQLSGGLSKTDSEIVPWSTNDHMVCYPFLPKFLNVCPRVGDAVKVIFQDTGNPYRNREYIGPLVSQPQFLNDSSFFWRGRIGLDSSNGVFDKSVKDLPSADGIYPVEEDIAFQGRENTDIIFRPNETWIRTGKHLIDNTLVRNDINPVYHKLKLLNSNDHIELSENRSDSITVANKIYLIGRDNNSDVIPPWIDEKEEVALEQKLHPLVYGDVLLEFMELMREWIFTHKHPYHNVPTLPDQDINIRMRTWFSSRLPDLLSKNIKAGGDIPVREKPSSDITPGASLGSPIEPFFGNIS
jgi:hypothetical protein